MSENLPVIALAMPSPLLNNPAWIAMFRNLARDLLAFARDMERFKSMPSYRHAIVHMKWLPWLVSFSEHVYRVVEEGRQKGWSGAYPLWEPFQIACAMLEEIKSRTDADWVTCPVPLVELERINELLAQQAPPPEGEPTADDSPACPVILGKPGELPIVRGRQKGRLTPARHNIIKALLAARENGLTGDDLVIKSGHGGAINTLKTLAKSDPDWASVILLPGQPGGRYRIASV